jgi:hypothetical protein
VADHRQIGDLDPAKAVTTRQFGAFAEAVARGAHSAAHVIGITETAERSRLQLHRASAPCVLERERVFCLAAVDLTEREMQVPSQMVKTGQFKIEPLGGGAGLRFIQQTESVVVPVEHPQAPGEPDAGLAFVDLAIGRGKRLLVSGQGLGGGPQLTQDLTVQAGKRKAIGARLR